MESKVTMEDIIDGYEQKVGRGVLLVLNRTATANLNDSSVTVQLWVEGDKIKHACYHGKGSILCQGIAGYICSQIVGMTEAEAAAYDPFPNFDFVITRPCAHLGLFALKGALA